MTRKYLTAEEYTAGIQHLTAEDVMNYGSRIVSSTMAIARLAKRYGKDLDRNILIQKCRRGDIRPMGRFGDKTLYFWTSQIDKLTIGREKREASV